MNHSATKTKKSWSSLTAFTVCNSMIFCFLIERSPILTSLLASKRPDWSQPFLRFAFLWIQIIGGYFVYRLLFARGFLRPKQCFGLRLLWFRVLILDCLVLRFLLWRTEFFEGFSDSFSSSILSVFEYLCWASMRQCLLSNATCYSIANRNTKYWGEPCAELASYSNRRSHFRSHGC